MLCFPRRGAYTLSQPYICVWYVGCVLRRGFLRVVFFQVRAAKLKIKYTVVVFLEGFVLGRFLTCETLVTCVPIYRVHDDLEYRNLFEAVVWLVLEYFVGC